MPLCQQSAASHRPPFPDPATRLQPPAGRPKSGQPSAELKAFGSGTPAHAAKGQMSERNFVQSLQSIYEQAKVLEDVLKAAINSSQQNESIRLPPNPASSDCSAHLDESGIRHQTSTDAVDVSDLEIEIFTEEMDDESMLRAQFALIDKDNDGIISIKELQDTLQFSGEQSELAHSFENFVKKQQAKSCLTDGHITIQMFLDAAKELPRVSGPRVKWANSLGLGAHLARLLRPGDILDGLKGLKELSDAELDAHILQVSAVLSSQLPRILRRSFGILRAGDSSAAAQNFRNDKFSMSGAFVGNFASLTDFHEGPEKVLGAPNPDVWEGMRREHCTRSNARRSFTSSNYRITTCPADEYEFVVCPREDRQYPHTPSDRSLWVLHPDHAQWLGQHGRNAISLAKLLQDSAVAAMVDKAGLQSGEVAALRLYTGPLFNLYNAVLRYHSVAPAESDTMGRAHVAALEGNRYETTLFCLISGILKLSKVTRIPPGRRLYRGLGGMVLPDQFWADRDGGLRGGVEWGLMSTTADRRVALQYSGQGQRLGTVLEISVGRVDIGADLSWLSQYPGEAEFLFPPLSCLEVSESPRVEGGVVVFALRVNICLKGLTLEQLVERRKLLHLAMVKNLTEELTIETAAALDAFKASKETARGV